MAANREVPHDGFVKVFVPRSVLQQISEAHRQVDIPDEELVPTERKIAVRM